MFDTRIIIHDDDREEVKLLKQMLHVLYRIEHILEPKFTLHINRVMGSRASGWFMSCDAALKTWNPITGETNEMAAIVAGQSGTFFLSATASDNSTPVLSAQTLTADDTNVTIAPDTSDASGNTFTVTVPASDTATTFNLSASASVTSNTSSTPATVTATLVVTVSPASVPVTFTLSINEK